jgi:hypothetical protein
MGRGWVMAYWTRGTDPLAPGVKWMRNEDGVVLFEAGSGDYELAAG